MRLVDAHVHLYEFPENQIKRFKKFILLSVAEDVSTSLKNIRLSFLYENIIPSVGIHPWNIEKATKKDLETIERLVKEKNVIVLGEIGLDKKFVPETYDKQKEFFEWFLNLAKEYDLSLNLHTPDTWREVFDYLLKYDIKKAYFHWYTGPKDLVEEMQNKGYFIGINPALKIQKKHKEILEIVNIKNIITESDGPYKYRNLYLSPIELEKLVKTISEVKNLDLSSVTSQIQKNLSKFLSGN